jgi:acetylornithine deacetylase/succinyl-diaminopimelate desuccinylase-like protein
MLKDIEEKVLSLVEKHRADNIALMQKLVQIPSISGDEADMGAFLVEEMKTFGLEDAQIVQNFVGRPNVVARHRGTTGKPSLTVYAHYDTVPPYDLSQWTHGPYSGTIEGDRIYGRGVNDHKFPIPPLLYALKAVKEAGVKLKGDLVFAFVGDEELGGHKGFKYVVEQGHCDTDYLLYGVGGGDGKSIGIAANGRAFYRVTVKGKTAHTGNNHMGVNAASKAAKLIGRIEELREDVNNRRLKFKAGDLEMTGMGRLSINSVEAKTIGNNVPDVCVLQVDRRLVPQRETFESGQTEIQTIVDALKKEDDEFDAEVEWVPDRWMNFAVSVPDSPLISALQSSAEKVLEVRPDVSPTLGGGSSDHGWFKKQYPDRPFASYGLSRGGNVHTYDEYATVSGLIDNTKIYALLFMELLGTY